MEENKLKNAKQNNGTLKLLSKISTIVIIVLLSLISFVGIYVKDKRTMKNVIPEYKLGTDLYIYGTFLALDHVEKRIIFNVRDFLIQSEEEKYEERLKSIKNIK